MLRSERRRPVGHAGRRDAVRLVACALVLAPACVHTPPLVATDAGADDAATVPDFTTGPFFDDDATMAIDGASLGAGTSQCRPPLLARVTRVVDGDTVHVAGVSEAIADLDIRFIGVNAPEIAHPPAPAECYGDAATVFTQQLGGHLVWLTFDADCLDLYGRTLAYVHYGAHENEMWQRQMLRRGFARTLAIAPNTSFATRFTDDETAAQTEQVGLWSSCP
jgi:micrococcal nuclease